MIRRVLITLAAAVVTAAGLSAAGVFGADEPEPPVRLKKKDKPPPEEPAKKPESPKEEKLQPEDDRGGPEADPREVLDRVAKNMRAVEERLANHETGDRTQQLERDVLKDLDALIAQKKQQQQQQQQQQANGGASSDPTNTQEGKEGLRRRQQGQLARGTQPGKQPQPRDDVAKSEAAGTKPGGGGSSPEGDKLAEVIKSIWGHYPEVKRQQMAAHANEKFMDEYKDLTAQYFSKLAEKSRRRGD